MSETNDEKSLTQKEEIELAVLRERNKNFNRFKYKLEKVINAEIELDDLDSEIYYLCDGISEELNEFKCNTNLCDYDWEVDEDFDMNVLNND